MPNFKVIAEFEHEGVQRIVGSELELTEEVSASLVSEGKVELVQAAE